MNLGERRRVYIAGPISAGDQFINVANALHAASLLMDRGFIPFVPHLTCFWHMTDPRPYEDWMQYDREWLVECHLLLRLPGESPGADREIQDALDHDIPVYYDIESLVREHGMEGVRNG